jgi:type IV pilus assembly protein PilY1
LQDRKNKRLWLYFGTGRNYFKGESVDSMDDCKGQQAIYGIKEPCYMLENDLYNGDALKYPGFSSCEATPVSVSSLTNQTGTPQAQLDTVNDKGWYVNLDVFDATTNLCAERNVTNPVALVTGSLFFTTYRPSSDPCEFGGNSYLWALKFDTGNTVPGASLYGKAVIQMSTGSFQEKDFTDSGNQGSVFTDKAGRRTGDTDASGNDTSMRGKPPADQPIIINRGMNKPVKKVIHLLEK